MPRGISDGDGNGTGGDGACSLAREGDDVVMHEQAEAHGPFPVYVPQEGAESLSDVLPHSAIVGFPTEADPNIIHVYYEGNRYGSPELACFANRAKHAAGRCRFFRLNIDEWRDEHGDTAPPPTEYGYVAYPTSAQALVPAAELTQIGGYDDYLGLVKPSSPEQAAMLRNWISSNDPLELVATGREFETRRDALGDSSLL